MNNNYFGHTDNSWQMVYTDELQHHGIVGQRKGIKNGPPYPLSPNAYSARERKAARANSSKESAKVILRKIKTGTEKAVQNAKVKSEENKVKREQAKKEAEIRKSKKEAERAKKIDQKEKEALAKEKERAQKEAEKLKITKTKILNSNDPHKIIEYQEYFTNDEIKNALARTKNLDQLREIESKRDELTKKGDSWLKKAIKDEAKGIGNTLVKNISAVAISAAVNKVISDSSSDTMKEIFKNLK